MLFKYLLGNKTPKIKRNTIIALTCDGGLAMVDVEEVHATAENCCIKRLLSETSGKWKDLIMFMWSRLDMNIELINKNVNVKITEAKNKISPTNT